MQDSNTDLRSWVLSAGGEGTARLTCLEFPDYSIPPQ